MNGRLQLPASVGMPRQLIIFKSAQTWTVSLHLLDCHFAAVFAASERLRLDWSNSMPVLWVGDTAFDLVGDEPEQISRFTGMPLPLKPAAAGVLPPCPAPAVAGPSSEVRA
ncbi:hypothetical protein SAMN04487785_102418 [Dyella jiangningensis]|uniref:hypothetical protein n=1 Tax=Dyella sp. AtDHG13 TaxID=1938897 RepID=UPI00088626F3|nr:hypothetical protein [Dyella sp. AtDHG13]PXV60690.1 hypothetical protein BDW41_102417 [Dyella sp. AtDHG13]SDJ55272.1 hypothetical protein SAMN04487785_102418 [Dyella jiangningensis]